jgi:Flp pilus assembly protein TadD
MALSARTRRERRLEAARGYLALDMPNQALRELNAIDDPEECPFAAHHLRGEALRQREDYESALDHFQLALGEEPKDLSVLLGMAWCLKRVDRLDDAITTMERAYECAPQEAIVLYNLACYHALAGHKSLALSWLGRALRMEGSLRVLIPEESDFDGLRHDPDFQFVTSGDRGPGSGERGRQ